MKGGRKQFFKKFLVYILSVFILSLSIGDVFIKVNDIDTSYAAAPVALGLDVMYSICEYYGSVFLSYSCGRSMPELSSDDVAELGHDLMLSMYGNDSIFKPDIVYETPFMTVVDNRGQAYVFGSEALQETAETNFTVIQGGKNDGDGDDDDDDENDNIIHFPKATDAAKQFFAMTTVGAAAVSAVIKAEYDKWVNGDADNILDPFFAKYPDVTDEDIQKQWSKYGFQLNMKAAEFPQASCYYCGKPYSAVYSISNLDCFKPVAALIDINDGYSFRTLDSTGNPNWMKPIITITRSCCGKISSSSSYGLSIKQISSFTTNVPLFTNLESCDNYLKTGTGYEDAINYTKSYRNADWLQDDWAGELLDPLTGLTALSNWYNLARHQGLNALGNNPSIQDLLNYLRDYFANLGTDVLPEVDPSLAPIAYPSTMPEVTIDPGRNPAVQPSPGSGTKPDPGTKPGSGSDPDTSTDSDPDVDPLPDINVDPLNYQVDLRGLFPFCIPFDFVALLNTLDADPEAPCFTFPVSIPALDYREDIKLDMSIFNDVAKVIRICEKVSFLIFLMFATSKVIRW